MPEDDQRKLQRVLDTLEEIAGLRGAPGRRKRFDLFRDLRMERNELRHTTVLAWLLDPRGSHQLGARFLRVFLECCEVAVPPAVAGFVVLPEFYLDAARENRLDVLILGVDQDGKATWACAVEGKIDSKEGKARAQQDGNGDLGAKGKTQLQRYKDCIEANVCPEWKGLYLTLRPEARLPGGWASIQWGKQVAAALARSVKADTDDDHLNEFLVRYEAFIRTLAGDSVDEDSGLVLHWSKPLQDFADAHYDALKDLQALRDQLAAVEWVRQDWGPAYLMHRDLVDELLAIARPKEAVKAEQILLRHHIDLTQPRNGRFRRINVKEKTAATLAFVPRQWDEWFPGRKPFYYVLTHWSDWRKKGCFEFKLQCRLSGGESAGELDALRALHAAARRLKNRRDAYYGPADDRLEKTIANAAQGSKEYTPKLGSVVQAELGRHEEIWALIEAQTHALEALRGPAPGTAA